MATVATHFVAHGSVVDALLLLVGLVSRRVHKSSLNLIRFSLSCI